MKGFLFLCAVLLLTPPSGAQQLSTDPRDPWETFNRSMFEFNDKLDQFLVKPVAQAYQAVTPEPVRNCVTNIFGNIGDVWSAANSLLQGKPGECTRQLVRVGINTVFGIGGCFDVASQAEELEKQREDFGQTLGVWGMPSGPYLVLPVFGPRSVRDSLGLALDQYTDPVWRIHDMAWRNSSVSLRFVSNRAELLQAGKTLEQSGLDPYIFVRDVYLQRRLNAVYDGNPPDTVDTLEPTTSPQEKTP